MQSDKKDIGMETTNGQVNGQEPQTPKVEPIEKTFTFTVVVPPDWEPFTQDVHFGSKGTESKGTKSDTKQEYDATVQFADLVELVKFAMLRVKDDFTRYVRLGQWMYTADVKPIVSPMGRAVIKPKSLLELAAGLDPNTEAGRLVLKELARLIREKKAIAEFEEFTEEEKPDEFAELAKKVNSERTSQAKASAPNPKVQPKRR
jgi:hypothetical protein